uniref:Cbl proto-oncogene-like 1, E3 ubiquitin protein ligase n=1 Tax=Sander lucioperca TaxID=283035 RepID=A0A8D0D052_SANLU
FPPADNDLQGSDGSGILGGPDVRRRIPIKLISKQPIRSKPQPRTQRPSSRPCKSEAGEDDTFGFKQEERFDCGAKAGDVFATQRRFPQALFWDYKHMQHGVVKGRVEHGGPNLVIEERTAA